MTTDAQLSANQANAQLSTGPRTEAGKAASSRNHLRLGFRSQSVLLPGDDPADYDALLSELTAHFSSEFTGRHSGGRCERSTVDLTEERFVREMADAEWRLRRLRKSLQSALSRRIAELSADHPEADHIELQSRAIETFGPATGTSYSTWLRYETKFERQYDRAYKGWLHYQTNRRRVSDKEADIWMRRAIFHPVPGQAPATNLSEGQHASASLTKLASTVQNAAQSLPSAQDATRASVVRGSNRDEDATRASVVRDSNKPTSTVQNGAQPLPTAPAATQAAIVHGSNEVVRSQIARSSPCPCGSGEKYKRCCGRTAPPLLGHAA